MAGVPTTSGSNTAVVVELITHEVTHLLVVHGPESTVGFLLGRLPNTSCRRASSQSHVNGLARGVER